MRRGREKSSLEGTRVHRIKNKISLRKGETNGISQTYLLSKQQQSEGRENVILHHFLPSRAKLLVRRRRALMPDEAK